MLRGASGPTLRVVGVSLDSRGALPAAMITVLIGGGVVGCSGAGRPPSQSALETVLQDPRPEPRFDYSFVPPVETIEPETSAARLERRLAAFAAAVERYRDQVDSELAPVDFDREGLEAAVDELLNDLEDDAQVSVHVRDIDSNAVLFDYFGDTPLNPASNNKILTSAAAIDLLGSDYVWETRIYTHGDALYVEGTGDPKLLGEDLPGLAERIIEEVSLPPFERLVVDDTAFSARRFAPGIEDFGGVGEAYTAPSGALSLDFNTTKVVVYPIPGSSRPAARADPPSAHVEVVNRARIGGTAKKLRIVSSEYEGKTRITITGKMPAKSGATVERRRVFDPALYTGGALAHELAEQSGSEPLPVEHGEVPEDAELIVTHISPPLFEVVDGVLAYSNNFTAEQLLRTLGSVMTGDPGDWENGTEVLEGYWTALGNDPDALALENGSGLSQSGRLTTAGLVDLISLASRSQQRGTSLIDALPVAGEEGTLRTRLRNSGKRVRAKTGTLDGVSGLTGVITAEDGTPEVAFSIIINVRDSGWMMADQRRRAEDAIVSTVLSYLDDYHARAGFMQFDDDWVEAGASSAASDTGPSATVASSEP